MSEPNQYAAYPSLRDKVVVVSGGASGIGEGIVQAFAEQGAKVAFLDVADATGHALVERLAPIVPVPPVYYRCDLTDVAAIRATATEIQARFGTVHTLVNNAGNDARHTLEDTTPEMWDAAMAVNLRPQFFLAQALLPGMRSAKCGSIINLSSIAWMIPSTGLPAYVTAKAAIIGLTRTLAHEVGRDNIRVNAVLPGGIFTERQRKLWLTPEYVEQIMERQALKRELAPEDVARMILFLAADDSSGITNQSFVVDGGWV